MLNVLSGSPGARKASVGNRGSPFNGRLPFGQYGSPPSTGAVGATRGASLGEPEAAWAVGLLVSPLKRGSGLWAIPQRPMGSLIWMRAPFGAPSASVQPWLAS